MNDAADPSRAPMALLALTALLAAGCGAPAPTDPLSRHQGDDPPLQVTSVTVFPIVLAGHPDPRVAEVVGVMLERGGLPTVELADTPFRPGPGDVAEQAVAFAAEVERRGLQTDCALFAAYDGTPGQGVDEVRSAVVGRDGRVVWTDRQRPGDPAFDRFGPTDPMTCTQLLVDRLRQPLHLDAGGGREDGPLATKLRQRSLRPSDAEYAAIDRRAADLAARLRSRGDDRPTVLVLPARLGPAWGDGAAAQLARRIGDLGLQPTVAESPVRFDVTADRNQQTVLWSAARSLQQQLRSVPPDADYVLATDFVIQPDVNHPNDTSPKNGKVWAVHTFLLDRSGDWVVVDYQNSHHDDFQAVAPASVEDCCELSARRLQQVLR